VPPNSSAIFVCALLPESERAQQHGGDEREYGEHGQHIEPQSEVHGSSPVFLGTTKV
jgi:hypothetical protein